MKILFWGSVLVVLYTYLLYPQIVNIISHYRKKPVKGKYIYPMVSIILPVSNSKEEMEAKAQSLLNLDYPRERMEILVGSDTGQGKPEMMNTLANKAKGELLVFTTPKARIENDALKEIVRYFSDPQIGSVSAELHYEGETQGTGSGLGLYWQYEKFIRRRESKMGSMLGATEGMFAIRKELYPELPRNLILDDVYIPMLIVQKGYRAIFDTKTKIYEPYPATFREEFRRKARTLAGNFQLFMYMRWLFNPFKSPVAWQMFSHKFLRLAVPFLLVAIFVSNFYLLENNFYWTTLILQAIFYILALLGFVSRQPNPLFDIPRMFCVMNAAAVAGLYKFATNKEDVL